MDIVPDWANLPKHLLDLIEDRLRTFYDSSKFGSICVSWNSIFEFNKFKRYAKSCHHEVPMLLVKNEAENTWDIYNVLRNKFLELKLLVPHNERFCGSSEGWLVAVNKDYTVTLFRPSFEQHNKTLTITKSKRLPCLYPPQLEVQGDIQGIEFHPCAYHVRRSLVAINGDVNSKRCALVLIFGGYELAIIRLGEDSSWTRFNQTFSDILYYKNLLYVVHFNGTVRAFDIWHDLAEVFVAPNPIGEDTFGGQVYLAESYEGQLLQITRLTSHDVADYDGPLHDRKTIEFTIYRLDVDKWVMLNSIGENSLFLGDNTSVAVLASDFPGCQPDCIYFTHDIDDMEDKPIARISDIGIFEIKSKKFKFHYNLDSATLNKLGAQPPIWLVGNPYI